MLNRLKLKENNTIHNRSCCGRKAGRHSARQTAGRTLPGVAALVLLVCLCFLTGCGHSDDNSSGSGSLKVVCAIAPIYDWTRNIIADDPAGEHTGNQNDRSGDIELTLLMDKGVDLHSYQPSAEDLNKISGCDLFIYVGGESDKWVSDALAQAQNKDMHVISLMDILGDRAKEEERKEGMQAAHEKHSAGAETEYDEHVWLSLRNAQLFTEKIAEELSLLDAGKADAYKKNADAYIGRLKKLDREYTGIIKDARLKTLLFADRFPFRYMTDDYGLDYYAAFIGCSSESEASFDTMTFLAEKLNKLSMDHVMTIDGSDQKLAHSVIDIAKTVNQRRAKEQKGGQSKSEYAILTLDSMQSSSKEQIDSGSDYIRVMKNNLAVLKKALN